MNKMQVIINETFNLIPEEYFLYKNKSDESIYVTLDKVGYKLDTEGKIFKTKAGIEIRTYEIKSSEIKSTKAETLNVILNKFKSQVELLEQAKLARTLVHQSKTPKLN